MFGHKILFSMLPLALVGTLGILRIWEESGKIECYFGQTIICNYGTLEERLSMLRWTKSRLSIRLLCQLSELFCVKIFNASYF